MSFIQWISSGWILQEQEQYRKFLHDNYGAVVTRFKIMGKLDIAEKTSQDGA